jgi:hypothetical protein
MQQSVYGMRPNFPHVPDDFGACKKIQIMASSNIFLRKDAPNWQLFNIKRYAGNITE